MEGQGRKALKMTDKRRKQLIERLDGEIDFAKKPTFQ